MDTWYAVDSIRVVREFEDRPLATAEVVRILNAGRRAGSSKNLQRWGFVLVREKARLARLARAGPWAGHLESAAAAIALVTPDPHVKDAPLSVMWDLGRAAQNMVLVAWNLRIGSCPATVYDYDLARHELAFPCDHHCEYILSFGYPADPAVFTAPKSKGGRRALEQILHEETW